MKRRRLFSIPAGKGIPVIARIPWIRGAVACVLITGCSLVLTESCAHTRVTVEGRDRMPQSKAIAQEFSTTLRSELHQAIQEHGPAGAISICKGISPRMEQRFAAEYPELIRLRRISLKTRNPQTHTPTPEEKQWLLSAQEAMRENKTVDPGLIVTRGKTTVLFPITINDPVCLLCHGDPQTMMKEVKTALRTHYPQDQATAYQLGDFRGALAIEWHN
ncbi:MAG: DUF3365 domain-containing protein [bacterium]